jgi:hypothetical protein
MHLLTLCLFMLMAGVGAPFVGFHGANFCTKYSLFTRVSTTRLWAPKEALLSLAGLHANLSSLSSDLLSTGTTIGDLIKMVTSEDLTGIPTRSSDFPLEREDGIRVLKDVEVGKAAAECAALSPSGRLLPMSDFDSAAELSLLGKKYQVDHILLDSKYEKEGVVDSKSGITVAQYSSNTDYEQKYKDSTTPAVFMVSDSTVALLAANAKVTTLCQIVSPNYKVSLEQNSIALYGYKGLLSRVHKLRDWVKSAREVLFMGVTEDSVQLPALKDGMITITPKLNDLYALMHFAALMRGPLYWLRYDGHPLHEVYLFSSLIDTFLLSNTIHNGKVLLKILIPGNYIRAGGHAAPVDNHELVMIKPATLYNGFHLKAILYIASSDNAVTVYWARPLLENSMIPLPTYMIVWKKSVFTLGTIPRFGGCQMYGAIRICDQLFQRDAKFACAAYLLDGSHGPEQCGTMNIPTSEKKVRIYSGVRCNDTSLSSDTFIVASVSSELTVTCHKSATKNIIQVLRGNTILPPKYRGCDIQEGDTYVVKGEVEFSTHAITPYQGGGSFSPHQIGLNNLFSGMHARSLTILVLSLIGSLIVSTCSCLVCGCKSFRALVLRNTCCCCEKGGCQTYATRWRRLLCLDMADEGRPDEGVPMLHGGAAASAGASGGNLGLGPVPRQVGFADIIEMQNLPGASAPPDPLQLLFAAARAVQAQGGAIPKQYTEQA